MTLDVFKQILEDVDQASKLINANDSERHAGHTLLSKIRNTMSDRAATEDAFDTLIEKKDVLSRMNNFFCGLHLLVGFAETAEKIIHKFEALNNDALLDAVANPQTKHFTNNTESGVARTIRTCAKCYIYFYVYIQVHP